MSESVEERMKRVNEIIVRRAKNKNLVAIDGRVRTVLSLAVKICIYQEMSKEITRTAKNDREELNILCKLNRRILDMEETFHKIGFSFSLKEAERLGVLLSTTQNKEAKNYIFKELLTPMSIRNRIIYSAIIDSYSNSEEYAERINKRDGMGVRPYY